MSHAHPRGRVIAGPVPGGGSATLPRPGQPPVRAGPGSIWADWDVYLLLVLMLADVRVLQGSSFASFTLYELYVWGYCAPVVLGRLIGNASALASPRAPLVFDTVLYIAWVVFASLFALVARQHSDVLQDAKNIAPALPLVCFLALRLRSMRSITRVLNLYVLACLAAGVLALVQVRQGGPYLRPPIENNDYKLDYSGGVVFNLVLGFSGTPNELGVTVLPGAVLCAVRLVHEVWRHLVPRFVTLACFGGCAMALYLAESRGALIWSVLAVALVVAPTRRSRSTWLDVGLVGLMIGCLVGYGIYHSTTGDPGIENTVLTRVELWRTALAAMADDPYVALLGDGSDYVKLWSWQRAGWEFPDAHNGWLDQALFFGLPAAFLYVLIWRRFFSVVEPAAADPATPPDLRVILDGCRGVILGYMGLFFFEPVADSVLAVGQLFLFLGCGMSAAASQPPMPAQQVTTPAA